ncbi:MAG TPA: LiaF-related protein [Pseudobdellovibrionaceae bacterium]|nr:LiaF-related protein [Pseudobdellovibrionaceae bacterium]
MFWGFLFLAVGILIIIQHTFNIQIPFFKVLFGLFLVYLGLRVIFGSFGMHVNGLRINKIQTNTEAVFSENNFKTHDEENKGLNSKYTTAFGSSTLNLENLSDEDLKKPIYITNAFGKTFVKTNPQHGIKAEISVGFGSVKIRGQKLGSLGEIDYISPNYKSDTPYIQLEVDNAFGEVEIE